MRSRRKLRTAFTDNMTFLVKSSCKYYEVSYIEKSSDCLPSKGLGYYKNVTWSVEDDISVVRPVRDIIEVFVGFDSEYKAVRLWSEMSEDYLYHTSITSRHVKGDQIFQELEPGKRKEILRRNKSRLAGYRNSPISYQFSIFSPRLNVMRNVILLTRGVKKDSSKGREDDKVTFRELTTRLVELILEGKTLTYEGGYPILRIYLISHFTLAELQTFSDFNELKRDFDSIRGRYVTMGAPYELNTPTNRVKGLESIDVEIILNDTSLLAPANYQSLAALGKVVGLDKIEIEDKYKSQMDKLLAENVSLFYEYAIRDSVIALAYWIGVHVITSKSIGANLFQTVGSISIGYFNNYLKQANITRKSFFGLSHSKYHLFRNFPVNAFHGGRNETIHVGTINTSLYDVDLAGAYSIAMAKMPQLDHSRSFVTNDLNHFIDTDSAGFAEVEFEYHTDVKMPCLPVKTKSGLVYPLRGTSSCTSYELSLAIRQGAKIRIISGLIIPHGEGEPVLKRFVKDIRAERLKHKKGTLENDFYKLILNSLYGRFALGINPKQYFNTRTGIYESQKASANSNPYLAALITGFIRAVLSELAHELSIRGYIIISMTTDGLIVNCPLEEILDKVESPLVEDFKRLTVEIGLSSSDWLELKVGTEKLFSWKTRGQFALDHGKISAMAGLQKPRGDFETVRDWVIENVAGVEVKVLNEVGRLASLLEVYKGFPFVRVEYLKYISTQYDFKRRLLDYDETSLSSRPWESVKEMENFKKRYTDSYPYKINSKASLEKFEGYVSELEARKKAERARKRRIEGEFKVNSLLPKILKQCSRCALQGAAGFTRRYTAKELIHFLAGHGIKEYAHGKICGKIDSNFCKLQKRREISYNSVPLSVDVVLILSLFKKLDEKFDPKELFFKPEFISDQPDHRLLQLKTLLPESAAEHSWTDEYRAVLNVERAGKKNLSQKGTTPHLKSSEN